jgi:hypothetical protein
MTQRHLSLCPAAYKLYVENVYADADLNYKPGLCIYTRRCARVPFGISHTAGREI